MQTCNSQCNPFAHNDAHGTGSVHCYTEIINAFGLSEKKLRLTISHLGFWSRNLFLIAPFPDLCLLVPLYVFLILSLWDLMTPGRGYLSPQGHEWQDLCIPNYNIAAYKTYKFGYCGFKESTSRQRSGKGAIRKDSLSKNRGGKKQTNNKVLRP